MTSTYQIPAHRTDGKEVQDMDLPKIYSLHLTKTQSTVIPDFSPAPTNRVDTESGLIYVVGGKGGVVQYVGMSAKRNITGRINRSTMNGYRWATDDYYYNDGKATFKVAVWEVPFHRDRDLEGIEIDVATFYRALVGVWPVDQIDVSATNLRTINSSRETWRYARAIIEDMNKYLTVGDNPFLPFLDDEQDNETLQRIATRSSAAVGRSYTRDELWRKVSKQTRSTIND